MDMGPYHGKPSSQSELNLRAKNNIPQEELLVIQQIGLRVHLGFKGPIRAQMAALLNSDSPNDFMSEVAAPRQVETRTLSGAEGEFQGMHHLRKFLILPTCHAAPPPPPPPTAPQQGDAQTLNPKP